MVSIFFYPFFVIFLIKSLALTGYLAWCFHPPTFNKFMTNILGEAAKFSAYFVFFASKHCHTIISTALMAIKY